MKKKIVLVSTLVLMAMSAMFVACEKDVLKEGCDCTFNEEGETWTEHLNSAEMMNYGATNCSALASALRGAHASHGMTVDINCK
jgi:hypothetical protein